jgi:tetratricopeptide (TPR) repeat protein
MNSSSGWSEFRLSDQALQQIEEEFELQSGYVSIKAGIALCKHYLAINEIQNARALCNTLLGTVPINWQLFVLTRDIAELADDDMFFIEACKKIRQSDPDYRAVHFPLGDHYSKSGDERKALVIFREAIRLFLDSPRDLGRLSERLIKLDDYQSAWMAITAALQLDPNNETYQYLRDFSLSGSPHFLHCLNRNDEVADFTPKRIFIGGCGRSGTWLCEQLFACFDDCQRNDTERHFGRFAYLPSGNNLHVLKRMHNSHRTLEKLPHDIGLIYMIRHPFDVLVSEHLGKTNFISFDNWMSEYKTYLQIKDRPNTVIVRYEELVANPNNFQRTLETTFSITPDIPITEFYKRAKPRKGVERAMQSLRPFDESSIGKHLSNQSNIDFCRKILNIHSEIETCIENLGYAIDPRINA